MSEEENTKKVLNLNISKKVSKTKNENPQIKTCAPKEKQKRTIVHTQKWETCVSDYEIQNNMIELVREII